MRNTCWYFYMHISELGINWILMDYGGEFKK